ncbi:hypothetical protein Scep_011892 [Stephania cephalantha]|uniref:Uncharacterized protein n=1 Tax=Stephania cephalantha TaxID=152367 RepID=A0AAP0JE80_9MAGN
MAETTARSSGSREDADGAVQRWNNKCGEGQASLQDGDAVADATPGNDAGDQHDATSADNSDSGGASDADDQ